MMSTARHRENALKLMLWIAILVFVVMTLTHLASCTTADKLATAQATTQAYVAVEESKVKINAAITDLRATTSPTSSPAAIAEEKAKEKPLVDAAKGLDKVSPGLQAATRGATDIANGADPVAVVVREAGPFIPEPWRTYLGLAGIVGSLAVAWWKDQQAKKNLAAAQSMVNAAQAAIANGSITVKPNAPATVDSVIVDHPVANQLVDALAAAAPKI